MIFPLGLVLFFYYFVFVVKVEIVAVPNGAGYKPRHFILVQVYVAYIAFVLVVEYIVRAVFTVSHKRLSVNLVFAVGKRFVIIEIFKNLGSAVADKKQIPAFFGHKAFLYRGIQQL